MDSVKNLIVARAKDARLDLKAISCKLGKNPTYMQQFIQYGKPKHLPERVRRDLAELLHLDEVALGAPTPKAGGKPDVPRDDLFMVREVDVRGGAAFGGGVDDTEWNEPQGRGSIRGHQPVAHWGLPSVYARQELSLVPGKSDILVIKGDSMDDGTKHSLSSGDRAIIDLSDTDASQGAIFAVWDGHGVIVKQVEVIRGSDPVSILCKSLNARYSPIPLVLDGDVHIIGRVAAKISRM